MKTSTLVLAATIATAVYAQNIDPERFSRKSFTSSSDKRVDVIAGNDKKLSRQEAANPAVSAANGTALVVEEAEPEEEGGEAEEEEESESVSNILLLQFPGLCMFGYPGRCLSSRSLSLTNTRNPRAAVVKRKRKKKRRRKRRKRRKKKNPRQERHRNQEKLRPQQRGWRQNNLRP